jgi:hypothetical protein
MALASKVLEGYFCLLLIMNRLQDFVLGNLAPLINRTLSYLLRFSAYASVFIRLIRILKLFLFSFLFCNFYFSYSRTLSFEDFQPSSLKLQTFQYWAQEFSIPIKFPTILILLTRFFLPSFSSHYPDLIF